MDNSITGQNDNQEWLSTKEAALFWGIKPQQLRRNIQKFKKELGDEIRGGGKHGSNMYITKQGMIILRNMVNVKIVPSRAYLAKKEIAVKALEEKPTTDDPFLLQIEMVKQVYLDVKGLKQEVQEIKHEQKSIAPPGNMTTPQRDFLNERVRNFHFQSDVPMWRIWNKLHSEVGKAKIDEYEFNDYKKAMKVLKEWYRVAGLIWE